MTQNKHKGKRLLAGLLSFLMVATGLPLGEMDARASSLVPNTSLTDNGDRYPYMHTDGSGNNSVSYGSSSSTGFTFQKMGAGLTTGRVTNYDPNDLFYNKTTHDQFIGNSISNTNSFNVAAVIDDSDSARNATQKGYSTTVRTAYGMDYWTTYYGFGKPRPNSTDTALTYLDPYVPVRGLKDIGTAGNPLMIPDGITPDSASIQGQAGYNPSLVPGNIVKLLDTSLFSC